MLSLTAHNTNLTAAAADTAINIWSDVGPTDVVTVCAGTTKFFFGGGESENFTELITYTNDLMLA